MYWHRLFAAKVSVLLFLLLSGCASSPQQVSSQQSSLESNQSTAEDIHWNYKALLIAGDRSITAFDNARVSFKKYLLRHGVKNKNIRELSRRTYTTKKVQLTNQKNIEKSMQSLGIDSIDACLVFMSSHGNRSGFAIEHTGTLRPATLNRLLLRYCGTQPTILIVSACYSGVFAMNVMKHPNRIILTAARHDRTSFGCGVENEYTYYDECLIRNLKSSRNWNQVAEKNIRCIDNKESYAKSHPQVFIGSDVQNLPLPK